MGVFFFFQAEDGIRDGRVTGVQTCALPISQRVVQRVERLVVDRQDEVGPAKGPLASEELFELGTARRALEVAWCDDGNEKGRRVQRFRDPGPPVRSPMNVVTVLEDRERRAGQTLHLGAQRLSKPAEAGGTLQDVVI